MNCADITRLAPLYITGELEAACAADFDAHLKVCAACMREVKRQSRLDARLRQVILGQGVSVAGVDRRVRALIAAEAKGHALPRLRAPWQRWASAAGLAAAVILIVIGYGTLGSRLPRVYADAVNDHRTEIIEQQPRRWITDPAQIAALAAKGNISPATISALSSGGDRLVKARLCFLDHQVFLHLVFSDGAHEFSVYLRPRDAKVKLGPAQEVDNGNALCTTDIDRSHVVSIEGTRLVVLAVYDQSSEGALKFARFAAGVL